MTDWPNKISSATVGPRDYGQGVVISYWNGIVTSGSVEEATEKHGWPLKIEPFDKNRLFREITKLESKVEEMQKTLEWYADPKNYRHVESAAYSDVALDEGETARDALKGAGTNGI
jgi:hypothetical protein